MTRAWTNKIDVQGSSGNAQGFRGLAKRMEDLQPIFAHMQDIEEASSAILDYLQKLKL